MSESERLARDGAGGHGDEKIAAAAVHTADLRLRLKKGMAGGGGQSHSNAQEFMHGDKLVPLARAPFGTFTRNLLKTCSKTPGAVSVT